MRWFVVIGIVLLIVVLIMSNDKKTDVHKMMAKCRRAKKQKAELKRNTTKNGAGQGGNQTQGQPPIASMKVA